MGNNNSMEGTNLAGGSNVGWTRGSQCATGIEHDGYCSWTKNSAPPATKVGIGHGDECESGSENWGYCRFKKGTAPPTTDVGAAEGAQCTSGREVMGHCTYPYKTAPVGAYVGWLSGDQCYTLSENDGKCNQPTWSKWEKSCTGLGKYSLMSYLNDVHTKDNGQEIILNNCINTSDCGVIPPHNDMTPALFPYHVGRPQAFIFVDDPSTCLPSWRGWEDKKCMQIGISHQSAILNLPPGINSNNDEVADDSFNYCQQSGSTKCNGGNPNYNTPKYRADRNEKINMYRNNPMRDSWVTIERPVDPDCMWPSVNDYMPWNWPNSINHIGKYIVGYGDDIGHGYRPLNYDTPELKIPKLKIPELKIPELKIPELKINNKNEPKICEPKKEPKIYAAQIKDKPQNYDTQIKDKPAVILNY